MYSEVGNTIIFEKPFFKQFFNEAIRLASKTAVKEARIEAMKDVELSVSKASKLLGVSTTTVIEYCNKGHRKAGTLNHKKEGVKYIINRYDLELFKEKMKECKNKS